MQRAYNLAHERVLAEVVVALEQGAPPLGPELVGAVQALLRAVDTLPAEEWASGGLLGPGTGGRSSTALLMLDLVALYLLAGDAERAEELRQRALQLAHHPVRREVAERLQSFPQDFVQAQRLRWLQWTRAPAEQLDREEMAFFRSAVDPVLKRFVG